MTRTDDDRPCPQHRHPRSQCLPSDRHVHSMRFRDDTWEDAEHAAWESRSDVTTLTTLAMEAMLGYIRCYKCREDAPPVPAETGDLTGRPLREWIIAAEKQAVSQHPHHEPVMIGAARAGMRLERVIGVGQIEPAPAVFVEPGSARA